MRKWILGIVLSLSMSCISYDDAVEQAEFWAGEHVTGVQHVSCMRLAGGEAQCKVYHPNGAPIVVVCDEDECEAKGFSNSWKLYDEL